MKQAMKSKLVQLKSVRMKNNMDDYIRYNGCVIVGGFAIYTEETNELVKNVASACLNCIEDYDVPIKENKKCVLATEILAQLYNYDFEPLITMDDITTPGWRIIDIEVGSKMYPDGYVRVFNTNKEEPLRWRGTLENFITVDWKV